MPRRISGAKYFEALINQSNKKYWDLRNILTMIFCVEEKKFDSIRGRAQPGLPSKKELIDTMTYDYKRHGISTLFTVLNLQGGGVIREGGKSAKEK